MIVLDACVLIGYLDGNDAHHERALDLLTDRIDDDLVTSAPTMAEILVGPIRSGREPQVQSALRLLRVRALDLPGTAATRLAELHATTGLRLPDCCVLFTAAENDALLATYDDRLARVAEELGITVLA